MADPAARLVEGTVAPHRPALALALLVCFLYLPCLWLRDLWNPDEPRYAEVAREMVTRGDYMLPHLNGEVYGEKPPLFFWLGILAGRIPGVPEVSGTRLVSVLAALGTLLITFHLGRRLADAETGWLAAMVLATSSMFALHASTGIIDGTLAFLVLAAIAVGLRAGETGAPTLWAAFYALAGLAVITKGPVGLAIPAGVLLLMSIQEQGARGARAVHPIWGLAIVLGVAAAWLVPAIARGGAGYAQVILFKQNVGRAYESWHHREPIQFFLKVFPGSFLPWVVLLPTALYGAWRDRRARRGARFALTWFVFTFLSFSIVSGKKTRYLLPLFPAASLMVALELRALLPGSRRAATAWRGRLPVASGAALLAACGLTLAVWPFGPGQRLIHRLRDLSPDQLSALEARVDMPGALALVIPGLLILLLAAWCLSSLRTDGRKALGCLVAGWIALVAWAQWVAVPALDIVKSPRPLAVAALAAAGPDGAIVMYRTAYAGDFNVYTRRDHLPEMSGLERTATWLRDRPGTVVIAGKEDLRRLRSRLDSPRVVYCGRIGQESICAVQVGALQPHL